MSVQKTVVFTDLIGSTAVYEQLGNVKATQTVTRITRWISETMEIHGGTVVKTLGDGVLVVFPVAQLAIKAVVDMQRKNQKLLSQQASSQQMPIRVGVATGEVELIDGDCYGDAVNVASRLNDLCGPNEIWVNSNEINFSTDPSGFQYRLLGPLTVRGRAEPCTVYQVDWNEEDSSDFHTLQADVTAFDLLGKPDALGAEIQLAWMDQTRSFHSFDLPIHLGRSRHSDFVISDPRVSRTHARLEWHNGSILLVDLSSYGTWVRFEDSTSDVLLRREQCVLHGRGELSLGTTFGDIDAPLVRFLVQ